MGESELDRHTDYLNCSHNGPDETIDEAHNEIKRLRELLEECMPYLNGGVQYLLGDFPHRDKNELIQKYNELHKKLQKELGDE